MQRDDIVKYCNLMEEVKRRMNVINAFGAGSTHVLYKATTVETVYLQFRKMLELIAFGSLVANKQLFSQIYADFSKLWNARKLLDDLQKVNPHFYPQPMNEVPSTTPNVVNDLVPKTSGFLTRDEFVTLYKKCGKILHSENPYGTPIDYVEYEKSIQDWITKIIGLTNNHVIKLVNDPNMYLVHMKENRDDRVHHYVFAPTSLPNKGKA
ncbi:MAG: hypothetical protein JWM68_1305 [Verrucomicrobiales bacterium]|nr:hypothetical protein [Verrucomicrobiales bacterium]